MYQSTLEEVWTSIQDQLNQGIVRRGHPFRLMTLATISADSQPQQRIVVLRSFDRDAMRLICYTDRRSAKISHLNATSNCNLHFYHPKKRMQLSIQAEGRILETDEFSDIPNTLKNTRDYQTILPPGSKIDSVDDVRYGEQLHFQAIQFQCERIEYLQLGDPMHVRAEFKRNDQWQGAWLVP